MPTIVLVLFAFVCATARGRIHAVFTNAIMPSLVPRKRARPPFRHRLGVRLFRRPRQPRARRRSRRAVARRRERRCSASSRCSRSTPPRAKATASSGRSSAVWYLVFMIPFFLFVPDVRQPQSRTTAAPGDGRAVGHDPLAARAPRHAAVPHRAHDLHRRPHGHLHVRRHLRRGGVRLGRARARPVRHHPDADRRLRRADRRRARRPLRLQDRHPQRARHPARRRARHPVGRQDAHPLRRSTSRRRRRARRRSPRPASRCSSPSRWSSASSRRRCRPRAARCSRGSRRPTRSRSSSACSPFRAR